MFNFTGRRIQAQALLEMLRQSNMPEPSNYESSAESYFEAVANSEQVPVDVRLSAAESLGGLKILPILGRLSMAIQMSIALEDAVQAYKNDFRQYQSSRGL